MQVSFFVVLALVSGQSIEPIAPGAILGDPAEPPPTQVETTIKQQKDTEVSRLKIREVTTGAGIAELLGSPGGAAVIQFGVLFSPWERFAFRVPVSLLYAGNWGDINALSITPGVVYRFAAPHAKLTPYVGVGADLSLLSIDNYSSKILRQAPPQKSLPFRPSRATSREGGGPEDQSGDGKPGVTSAQLIAAPEATLGLVWRLSPQTAVDFGGRYLLIQWHKTLRHALTQTVGFHLKF